MKAGRPIKSCVLQDASKKDPFLGTTATCLPAAVTSSARKQLRSKCFQRETASRQAVYRLLTPTCPTSAAPRLAWHVEDPAARQDGVAVGGSPQVSVRSLLETCNPHGDPAL